MKKLLIQSAPFLFAFLGGISTLTLGQTLEENKVDEFTNNTVKRTSWEMFNSDFKFTAYFRVSQINDNQYFDLKLMLASGSVFSIGKDQEIMFKLSNDTIIKLPNLEYSVSCRGCGAKGLMGSEAQGIQVSYPISKTQSDLLKSISIAKVRIYTNDGYIEDEMKTKNAVKIKKALALLE